jgi:Xaa-Pro aminopeptidase
MRYKAINKDFFINNRRKLTAMLKPNSLAIVHSADEYPRNGDQCFPFRQNSDMFFLTGLDQEKCILAICPDHPLENMREIVFTVKTSDTMVTWYGHKYTLEQAGEVSGVKTVKWLDDFEDTMRDLIVRSEFIYLNANENNRFITEVPYRDLRFSQRLAKEYPQHKFERLAPLITSLRLCKEPAEIEVMQKACDITEKAFLRVLKAVKPGMMEYEVEAEVTCEFIRNGAGGYAYYPIVASGGSACVLHYISNDKPCKDGDLLLLDFGAEYANYAADLSRTLPVNGKFTPRQKDCYNAVLRTMKKAKTLIVPGTTIDKINAEVCKILEKEMIGLGLFTEEDVKKQDAANPLYFKYYMHGNSHFIGLDVHDVGLKQTEFKPGMILSCEPGIYIKEENIGIRIENDILVTEKGPVDLMEGIPIEVDEIEKLMKK